MVVVGRQGYLCLVYILQDAKQYWSLVPTSAISHTLRHDSEFIDIPRSREARDASEAAANFELVDLTSIT